MQSNLSIRPWKAHYLNGESFDAIEGTIFSSNDVGNTRASSPLNLIS